MAAVQSAPLDLDQVWAAARLTGDLDAVRRLIEDRRPEAEAA